MENNYYDKYGRLHHKPCIDGEPSSNNGWIYTAYYYNLHKINPNLQYTEDLIDAGQTCAMLLTRHPDEMFRSDVRMVPISRDEILGLAHLGFLKEEHLDGWNFSPYPIPRFNPFKLAAQLWELRPSLTLDVEYIPQPAPLFWLDWKHRNYFWQNNLDQLYRFAFSVPLVDRAFILECWGEINTVRYYFYKGIAKLDSMLGGESGIRWLKYGKSLAAMQKEFPEDHPLRSR